MNVDETVTSGSLVAAAPLAALAGLVSFLSPCVLPLVPGYLSYVTGMTGADLAEHAQQLVSAIRSHNPMLVYLDPGDPEPVLRRAAEERHPEWVESVVRYHTTQGYGLRVGLTGFDGYVAFMRMRRELELDLVHSLDLPTLVVATSDEPPSRTRARILQFVDEHA